MTFVGLSVPRPMRSLRGRALACSAFTRASPVCGASADEDGDYAPGRSARMPDLCFLALCSLHKRCHIICKVGRRSPGPPSINS